MGPTMFGFDPMEPLTFGSPDHSRIEKENALRALSERALRELYLITREEASRVKLKGQMQSLYSLTRGLKTLQRIGAERGIRFDQKRIGFLASSEIEVPEDFDTLENKELAKMFDLET